MYECKFLLTRPSRDVTMVSDRNRKASGISTHTPLAGRDDRDTIRQTCGRHFYPHPPRGTRPLPGYSADYISTFLLTRPSRDVTDSQSRRLSLCNISTHTPLAGRDICKAGGLSGML